MRTALVYHSTKTGNRTCLPPITLLYLATPLRQRGFEVAVLDIDAYPGGLRELTEQVVDYKPDLVGLPLFTDQRFLRNTVALTQAVREKLPDVKIVAGGPHPTCSPEQTVE